MFYFVIRLATENVVFEIGKYEELLEVYRRFVAFLDHRPLRKPNGVKPKGSPIKHEYFLYLLPRGLGLGLAQYPHWL